MNLLERAVAVFGDVERPAHFTNFRHCPECAEHDETLQRHDPQSLGLAELSPAWDPMCFVTPDAFRYFLPGLVRLALQESGEDYFIGQLLFHLISDGLGNDRWKACTRAQRRYVVELLDHLVETRAEELELNGDTDNVFRAIEIWSDGGRDARSAEEIDA